MQIDHIDVRNFRNIEHIQFNPHPHFNVVSGLNGHGKTNLLEAIFWLATLRPFRTNRLREIVRWGHHKSNVKGLIQSDGLEHRLSVGFSDGQSIALRENKKVRANQYFGALSVVLFTPDDVGLIKGAPERRRRFIDRGIFTGRPAHLDDFLTYRRALDARNKLLRDKAGDDLLDVYEHTLAQVGAQLVAARKKFIDDLKPLFKSNVETILTSQSGVELRYRQSIPESNSMAEDMIKTWGQDRIKDRERGFTQKGPHADDLVITLHGHSARSYASQGQQRSLVLALKLAEIQLLEDKNNSVPIVLLDDVSSELDAERNARLFEFLNGFAGQVFITTTDPAYLQIKDERQNFVIDKGVLASQEI